MSLADIRAVFETELFAVYQAMTPPVPVMFDNVQEEPPAGSNSEYVLLNLTWPSITEPILCLDESGIEVIRGNVQISCFTPRAQGMKRLEAMASVGITTLNYLKKVDPTVNVCVGVVAGPVTVLSGDNPHALAVVSAPFTAKG